MVVLVLALAAIGHSTVVIERSSTGSCHHVRPTGPGAGLASMNGGAPDSRKQPDLALDRNLKDGYFHVACKLDSMEEMADKFGSNAQRYEGGHAHTAFGNVSIVRYVDHVGREDRELMTPQVCFDFCRTVPDMLFFGIRTGRDCYCTPYFVSKPGGSEACDFPCEGNSEKICGGLTRSSLYEMHLCAETRKDILALTDEGEKLWNAAKPEAEGAVNLALTLEATADKLMRYVIGNGDMLSHANGQAAKVMAGKLKHAGEDAVKAATTLRADLDALDALKDEDFGYAEKAYEAEAQLAKTRASMQAMAGTREICAELDAKVHPDLPSFAATVSEREELFDGPKDYAGARQACDAMGANLTKMGTYDVGTYAVGAASSSGAGDGDVSQTDGYDGDPTNYTCNFEVRSISADTALGMFNSVLASYDETSASTVNDTLPTTCEGKYAAKPMTNLSLAECAEACVSNAPKSSIDYCVSFQYYEYDGRTSGPGAALQHSLCYLYRAVGKVDYFECEAERLPIQPSFLERLTRRVRRHGQYHGHRHHKKRRLRGALLDREEPPSRDDGPSDFSRVSCYALLDYPPREAEFEKRPHCWGLKAAKK